MDLEQDEHIVLDDGTLGYKKKITLTNKRLIIQKGGGLFKGTCKKEKEIPLVDIEEAYVHVESSTSMSIMKLRLKSGNTEDIQFKLRDSEMAGASLGDPNVTMPMKVKSITDRWVNAINNQKNIPHF